MATEKKYRSVHGIVQFEPREGEAGGKDVRNITVRQVGFAEQSVRVSATLWPSHAHVKVDEGDVVTLEGAYTRNTGEKDGQKVVYHNLSVSKIKNHGPADSGEKVETTTGGANDATDPGDDDIPF